MNWFKQLLKRPGRDPFYVKNVSAFHSAGLDEDIYEVYFLGGCAYGEHIYEEALIAINEGRLDDFLKNNEYNSHKDNIEFYLFVYKVDSPKLIVTLDPVELYGIRGILKVYSLYEQEKLVDLRKKRIYP